MSGYLVGATGSVAVVAVSIADRYNTQKEKDKATDLIGPDDRPLPVDETRMNSLQGRLYKFTHKAVWGCWILLPAGGHLARDVINKTAKKLPPTEHWAFVARAECRLVSPPSVAYFIAQFCRGDYIQQPGNNNNSDGTKPFRALFQEQNKAHAALSIVLGPSNPDVWVHKPGIHPRRYVYEDETLVSPVFKSDEWVPMRRPMKLRELNNHIYQTRCTGKKYHPIKNNCQHFATDLFNDVY